MSLILSTLAGRALSVLRLLPPWAWALLLALAWGGWQHHRATAAGHRLLAEQQAAAEARARALQADATETTRRLEAQRAIADQAQTAARAADVDAAAARAAADRLRQRLAAATSGARPASSATAAGSAPANDTEILCPDLLGRALDAARLYAGIADQRGGAGTACERSYDALTNHHKE